MQYYVQKEIQLLQVRYSYIASQFALYLQLAIVAIYLYHSYIYCKIDFAWLTTTFTTRNYSP